MRWKLRRLLLGDRRKTERVLTEAKRAFEALDRALAAMECEQQGNANER